MRTDVPTLNIPLILHAILEEYVLPWDGVHGIAHWARVLENGLRLAEETGANIEVVQLFAIFHDSQRVNEVTDPDHGPRAAAFALDLRGLLFDLPDHEFRLLHRACAGHTHERTHPNVTIQTYWDADRLDLARVGMTPHPSRLYTDAAKRRHTQVGRRQDKLRCDPGVRQDGMGDRFGEQPVMAKSAPSPTQDEGSSGSERGHQ
jgi:uncharacterized protein